MKKMLPFFLIILLVACVKDNNIGKGQSNDPVNEELKHEAKEIFKNKLENEGSYKSYSSSDVFYEISSNNLSLQQFNIIKKNMIEDRGWVFLKKKDQAYIFCQGTRQLEVIPPQELVGNKILGGGDIGRQIENKWNIILSHTINGTLNRCYLKSK